MPKGDEEEIATGVFRFALVALLERPTFNPSFIRTGKALRLA
jgi:hypothetical protein